MLIDGGTNCAYIPQPNVGLHRTNPTGTEYLHGLNATAQRR